MTMSKLKTLAYMLAASLAMLDKKEIESPHQNVSQKFFLPTCKDCYFYTGGTFCKRVKHHVSKQTHLLQNLKGDDYGNN